MHLGIGSSRGIYMVADIRNCCLASYELGSFLSVVCNSSTFSAEARTRYTSSHLAVHAYNVGQCGDYLFSVGSLRVCPQDVILNTG